MSLTERLQEVRASIPEDVTLVAVSKTHPAEMIREAYDAGQRVFGENRPQELREKYTLLPHDIAWHMIGHLQTNKVKYIAPFVALVHSVDSDRLLAVIDREAARNGRIIDVLFEIHVAVEETKSGWEPDELRKYLAEGTWRGYGNVRIRGLMAVASQTDDDGRIRAEFTTVRELFLELREAYFGADFDTLSMGMTHDYPIAVECGATMVRIGSRIFGARDYTNTNK
ncbi:MAG TPA: YggS family pyridoxal phosphate-dependent enzyme [Candidatus Tidjanibacter gallistercoris]|nr:YggS family pyridoxal phosphate-dependent enzyme [Candidatus Tidjanibacter gallistercoris]